VTEVVDLTNDYVPPQPQPGFNQGYVPSSLPQPGHLQHPRQHAATAAAPGWDLQFPGAPQYQQQQQQYLVQPIASRFGGDPSAELQAAIARAAQARLPPPTLRPANQQQQQQQQPAMYIPPTFGHSREQATQQLLNSNPMLLNPFAGGIGGLDGGGEGSGRGWNASHMLQQQRETGQGGTGMPPNTVLPPGQSISNRIISSGAGLPHLSATQLQQFQVQQQNFAAIAPLLQQQQNFDRRRDVYLASLAALQKQQGAGGGGGGANRVVYGGLGVSGTAAYPGPYRPASLQYQHQPQQLGRNSQEAIQAAMAALQTVGVEGEMEPPAVSLKIIFFLPA
jgi:hypothetical protein